MIDYQSNIFTFCEILSILCVSRFLRSLKSQTEKESRGDLSGVESGQVLFMTQ